MDTGVEPRFGPEMRTNRSGSLTDVLSGVGQCSDWVFIRESCVWVRVCMCVSTVSTKCEFAILQRQHTQTLSGLFVFYRKRYSGLPSLQNKCFLFLNLLDWHHHHHHCHRRHHRRCRRWAVVIVWILNCQNPDVVSKFSRDSSSYCPRRSNHRKDSDAKSRPRQESVGNNDHSRTCSSPEKRRDLLEVKGRQHNCWD